MYRCFNGGSTTFFISSEFIEKNLYKNVIEKIDWLTSSSIYRNCKDTGTAETFNETV